MKSLLFGLVLMGGQSHRMGRDKAQISYHGVEQWRYAEQLLSKACERVFLSVRDGSHWPNGIQDESSESLGPLSGILSAMRAHPDVAWLVLAVDMPFVEEQTLDELMSHRDPTKMATVFENPLEAMPEPLCAIYEPCAFLSLQKYQHLGPRRILANLDIVRVTPSISKWLLSVNTAAEMSQAQLALR